MRYAEVIYDGYDPGYKLERLKVPVREMSDFHKLCKEWGAAYREGGCIMMPYIVETGGYEDVVGTIAMRACDVACMRYVEGEPKLQLHDADGNVIGTIEDAE